MLLYSDVNFVVSLSALRYAVMYSISSARRLTSISSLVAAETCGVSGEWEVGGLAGVLVRCCSCMRTCMGVDNLACGDARITSSNSRTRRLTSGSLGIVIVIGEVRGVVGGVLDALCEGGVSGLVGSSTAIFLRSFCTPDVVMSMVWRIFTNSSRIVMATGVSGKVVLNFGVGMDFRAPSQLNGDEPTLSITSSIKAVVLSHRSSGLSFVALSSVRIVSKVCSHGR